MKNIILTIFIAIFPLVAGAQTAKVIQLKPEDALEASSKYEALQAAQKDWDALQERVKNKYTRQAKIKPDSATNGGLLFYIPTPYWLEGWEKGFSFSSDFLYIVPKVVEKTSAPTTILSPGFVYNTPAAGNSCYITDVNGNLNADTCTTKNPAVGIYGNGNIGFTSNDWVSTNPKPPCEAIPDEEPISIVPPENYGTLTYISLKP